MASVHKQPRSPYWFAFWRDSAGRLHKRSTKQSDRRQALTIALEFERTEKAAGAGTLTEAQCRTVLADILSRCDNGEEMRSPTLAAWLAQWLESKTALNSPGTALRYGQTVKGFLAHLDRRARLPLTAITARDVQGFLSARSKSGCAPSTVQVEGKTLRAAFNRARREGLISVNPAEQVDLPKRQSVERGTFTPVEVAILLEKADPEWQTCIRIGYFTGARLSECVKVRWEDVDLLAGTITFPKTKTGAVHVAVLHPELREHLESIAGDTAGPLMPRLAKARIGGCRGLSLQFKGILERAGLDADMVQGSGKRPVSRKSFHALRHSYNTALANAGVPEDLRMKLSGHKSRAVSRGYTHHELETLRSAVAKLPSLSCS